MTMLENVRSFINIHVVIIHLILLTYRSLSDGCDDIIVKTLGIDIMIMASINICLGIYSLME